MSGDIYIVGGGHAGTEAAFSIARLGLTCTIITMDVDAIGRMSCNPAIGGLAKSHLVKEIDAFGGLMPLAADHSGIQFKTLNMSKGPAVRSLRIQTDKKKYSKYIYNAIKNNKKIHTKKGEVVSFKTKNERVKSIKLASGEVLNCSGLIITAGTFLNGLIHIGKDTYKAGRLGEAAAHGLTECLVNYGLHSSRLKTGTPPRVLKSSIDWGKCRVSSGDKEKEPFSIFRSNVDKNVNIDTFSVDTSRITHDIINENINDSAMYSGKVTAAGPRYCPSIEDKVVRFKDRSSHSLFLEPEWLGSDQVYVAGFSTSLPKKTQVCALKSIKGLENIEFIRPGYAIEYDYIPTYQLKSSLESKSIKNLFLAGQINGTSGYEEAAAQGMIAGINLSLSALNKPPLIIKRHEGYAGVLIDDLVTKFIDEPYRMFTSRSEYRLSLRPDNVYNRLTPIARSLGLLDNKFYNNYLHFEKLCSDYRNSISSKTVSFNNKVLPLDKFIKQPKNSLFSFFNPKDIVSKSSLFSVETDIKYSGYVDIEKKRANKVLSLEKTVIPKNFNYLDLKNMSSESREKLTLVKPETVAQAMRIGGVSSSDITELCFVLSK